MNELLAALLALFHTKLVTEEPVLSSIHILDAFSMESLLKVNHLPALVISPISERHEQGPFADTAREIFVMRLRIVARSTDVNAYQVNPISGTATSVNVHVLSDMIRDILYQNKRLTSNTFEMRPRFDATDLNVLWNASSGQFSARDIFIEYTRLEIYTGMQNEQSTINISAFEF